MRAVLACGRVLLQARANRTRKLSHDVVSDTSERAPKFEKYATPCAVHAGRALSSSQLLPDLEFDAESEAAAVRIQAGVRGVAQRKKYNQMKAEMTEAATKIQANFR